MNIKTQITEEIILIGAGGHCRSCIDVLELEQKFKILGLIDKSHNKSFLSQGYDVLGDDSLLHEIRKSCDNALICIGQIKNPLPRSKMYKTLKKLDFKLPVICSPLSYVSSNSNIGEGTIVMHGSLINSGALVGRNCILNSKSLLEHDVSIGDNCHISTSAVINGDVHVGESVFIGSNATIANGVKIGNNCIIGAGLFVTKEVADNTILINGQ